MQAATFAAMVGDADYIGVQSQPIVIIPQFCQHGTALPHWHKGGDHRAFCPQCMAEWQQKFPAEELAAMWRYYFRTRQLPHKLAEVILMNVAPVYPFRPSFLLR